MSFLPHKKFTWTDFEGIYSPRRYTPDFHVPIALSCQSSKNYLTLERRFVEWDLAIKPRRPVINMLFKSLDIKRDRSNTVQRCLDHLLRSHSELYEVSEMLPDCNYR